ncbi:MAG: Rieske 2Fe-2S domain-containing protein [Actinomycetia bacterium]|nr:Rieske 2Fe-2S domain-containing protein [Actinomycetes bacterium]
MADEGRAYGLATPDFDRELYEVGPRTPAGELLRRYWHPVARSTEATDLPSEVRALGEDLILFRDRQGRVGLMHPRCCHRGTTLLYGKVEDEGIRCCYHGWLFDVEGNCTDQPCEPDRGRNLGRYRQPWYPVVEYHGLVFAYLGPPDRQPAFPRYDIFEDLGDDEEIVIVDQFAFGGPSEAPCNWFQTHENVMDPYHVFVLHSTLNQPQFAPELAAWPEVSFEKRPWGIVSFQDRTLSDGRRLHRVTEARCPTVRVVATPTLTVLGKTNNMSWALPIDDTHTRVSALVRKPKGQEPQGLPVYGGDKTWFELTDEEHQLYPGDYEAQVGQGPITWHSHERLSSSDVGVSMVRRLYKDQIEVVANGGDPVGVSFDHEIISVEAGNYVSGPG